MQMHRDDAIELLKFMASSYCQQGDQLWSDCIGEFPHHLLVGEMGPKVPLNLSVASNSPHMICSVRRHLTCLHNWAVEIFPLADVLGIDITTYLTWVNRDPDALHRAIVATHQRLVRERNHESPN